MSKTITVEVDAECEDDHCDDQTAESCPYRSEMVSEFDGPSNERLRNRLRDLCPFDDGDISVIVEGDRVKVETRVTVLEGMLDALAS